MQTSFHAITVHIIHRNNPVLIRWKFNPRQGILFLADSSVASSFCFHIFYGESCVYYFSLRFFLFGLFLFKTPDFFCTETTIIFQTSFSAWFVSLGQNFYEMEGCTGGIRVLSTAEPLGWFISLMELECFRRKYSCCPLNWDGFFSSAWSEVRPMFSLVS
jgi:hypothetical protein